MIAYTVIVIVYIYIYCLLFSIHRIYKNKNKSPTKNITCCKVASLSQSVPLKNNKDWRWEGVCLTHTDRN